jgi:hypothetical protein
MKMIACSMIWAGKSISQSTTTGARNPGSMSVKAGMKFNGVVAACPIPTTRVLRVPIWLVGSMIGLRLGTMTAVSGTTFFRTFSPCRNAGYGFRGHLQWEHESVGAGTVVNNRLAVASAAPYGKRRPVIFSTWTNNYVEASTRRLRCRLVYRYQSSFDSAPICGQPHQHRPMALAMEDRVRTEFGSTGRYQRSVRAAKLLGHQHDAIHL